MSFIFEELSDGDEWGRGADGVPERTVVKANLFEVSFVIFPAYPSTDAGLRNHKRGK
jgi:phage head maturation protease